MCVCKQNSNIVGKADTDLLAFSVVNFISSGTLGLSCEEAVEDGWETGTVLISVMATHCFGPWLLLGQC